MNNERRKPSIDIRILGEKKLNEHDSHKVSDRRIPRKSQLLDQRKQQSSRNTLISQQKGRKKSTIISNNSSKRKESLFLEYQDLFQQPDQDISFSSSSSENMSNAVMSPKQKSRKQSIEQRYSRHKGQDNSSEFDFITHTINSKMSIISKNITLNSQKFSTHQKDMMKSQSNFMKGTLKELKSMKSTNKMQFQTTLKIKRENSIVSQISQQSDSRQINLSNIIKILDNANLSEEERSKYLSMIEELEKKCEEIEPQKRDKAKRKVRQTFVNVFNQYYNNRLLDPSSHSQFKEYGEEIQSQYSMGGGGVQNESVFAGIPQKYSPDGQQMIVRHPSINNITSVLENSMIKESNDKVKRVYQNFIQNFQQEQEEIVDSYDFDSSQDEVLNPSSESEEMGDPTLIDFKKQSKRHQQKYIRDPFTDPYYLEWVSKLDYKWATKEFLFYYDNMPLLFIRKVFVLMSRYIHITTKQIINHKIFVLACLVSIIYNIIVFVEEQYTVDDYYSQQLRERKELVLYLFIIENVLKLLGNGFVQFFKDAWNVLDTIILVLFIINFKYPDLLLIDFTVIRLFRLLLFMGLFIKPLKSMLTALSKSVMFLMEALVIVFIFTYFFALVGLHLFLGLFRLRCHHQETGILLNQMCGYNQLCPSNDFFCAYSFNNPQYPTSFDDFIYSYGQIIRVMIYNDWTDPLYFSMRTFHAGTVIFFIAIIFIAGIFGTNLIIAVLKIYYSQTQNKFVEELLEDTNDDVINLMLIKKHGLDQDFSSIYHGTKVILKRIQNQKTIAQISDTQKQRKNVLKKKQKVRLLSARQAKEMEDQLNAERGIKTPGSQFNSFVDSLSIEYFLQTNYVNKLFWNKINENGDFQDDENKYEIIEQFKSAPFLSWRTDVKQHFDPYCSTSEQDIFTDIKKERLRKDKRKRELEFVRQMGLRQVYIIQQKDLAQQKRNLRKEMTMVTLRGKCKNKHKFPYKNRRRNLKFDLRINRATIQRQLSPQLMEYYQEQEQPLEKQYQEYMSSPFTVDNKKSNVIYLYGQEYNYDDIQKLINRKGVDAIDSYSVDIEEQYIQFRMGECEMNMIIKHNWSGDEVIDCTLNKKKQIFKSLNKPDYKIWLTGVKGYAIIIQKYTISMLRNKFVETIFDAIVLFNVLLLCLEGLVQSPAISTINDIFTLFLVIEILFKLISVGIVRFCYKLLNIFDTLVVTACLMEILIRLFLKNYNSIGIYLSLMRAMQGILFYRVIKYNKFAVRMAEITKNTFPSFFNLIILMLFVIYIFALIGMNLFKGKFPLINENGLLHSFLDVPKSFMAVFDRSTGDDWYGLIIFGTTYSNPTYTMIYGIALVYILIFMTFGLVLAIILDGFSTYSIEEDEEEENIDQLNTEVSDEIKDKLDEGLSLNTQHSEEESSPGLKFDYEQTQGILSGTNLNLLQTIQPPRQATKTNLLDLQGNIERLVEKMFRGFQFYNNEESEISLFLFPKESKFRKFCYRLVKYTFYNRFINFVIMVSLINMAVLTFIDNEYDHNASYVAITTLELCMNLLVAIDCAMKIVAFGFFHEAGAFTNEFWRTVDFGYLIAFFINQFRSFQIFYYISYIKYLRPMRFVNMFKSLKQLNAALAKSLKDLMNILIVQLMVWFIFAMFGVIIYKNKLGYCEYPLNFGVNQVQCLENNQEWITAVHNFDNIFNAISTLWVVCTADGWGLIFQVCYNANSSDVGPTMLGNKWITYIYFFLFQVIGAQFFMGFFTGILFVNFQTNRTLLSKEILTQDQSLFVQVTNMILQENPNYSDPPNSFLRLLASRTINNKVYMKIMSPAIFINTIILSLYYFEANIEFTRTLDKLYYGFSFLMMLDTVLKLMAYGPVRYWGYVWRKLELILSLVALIDFIMFITIQWTEFYFTSNIKQNYFIPIRLFFACRNLRSLLIIQEFKGLSRLLRILQFSLPFLTQILIIYFAVLFVYAYAGCEMFGQIDKGVIIDDYLNFTTFPLAMLTLFKCSTKNGWRFIMADCTYLNPYCENDNKYCGMPWLIVNAYFYSYVLLSAYIVLVLFVTGLVEQFEKFYNTQNSVLQTYIENIDRFRTIWCKYSSETKGLKMHTKYLAHFLLELGEPLGSMKGDNIWDAAKSASNFKIKAIDGYVHFQEVLYETVRYAYKQEIFHAGSSESIEAIKNNDRETRFRLHYKKINVTDRRQHISAKIHLKGNFNILQEYLYVLIVFKTWHQYTRKLFEKIGQELIIREGIISEPSNFSKNYDDEQHQPTRALQNVHFITKEDQEPTIDVPRYTLRRQSNKKPKLKFQDEENPHESDLVYEPEDPVNPQLPNDHFVNRGEQRLKSALKQQKYVFMEFDDPKRQESSLSPNMAIKKTYVPNPMVDDDSNNNAPILDPDQDLMNSFQSKRDNCPLNRSYDSWRSQEIASESHRFLQVKKFDLPYRSGRKS